MTRDELRKCIDGGCYIHCVDPSETGAALAFLRDELGYKLVDVEYVINLANHPSAYAGYCGTDSKYLYPHTRTDHMITLSSKIHGVPISFVELEETINKNDFHVDEEEFAALIDTLYMPQ